MAARARGTTTVAAIPDRALERADFQEAFARFLRLNVAQCGLC